MVRVFVVALAALSLAGCASRRPVIDAKLAPLIGKKAPEINAALCNTCKVSRNGLQMKCKAYLSQPTPEDDGCGGRHSKVKLVLNPDGGFSGMWEDID